MTIRWGIIGPGRIADTELAPAINRDPNSELVAVVSRDQQRAEDFASRHGARWAGTEYAAMLALSDVDAVLVTTPNALHVEHVVAAAEAHKHVLCDKPLAVSVAEARRALAACDRMRVRLGINFQTRQHTCFQEVRRLIDGGRIGDVIEVQIDASSGHNPPRGWRTDPSLAGLGAVNNVAIHIYDVVRFLLDDEVAEVAAMFNTTPDSSGVETLPMVLMRFLHGTLVYANGNQETPFPLNEFVIYGTQGRISGKGITRPLQEGQMTLTTKQGEVTSTWSTMDCYDRLVAAFSVSVLAGREPAPSGLDGLRSVQLTAAIATSVAERRIVDVEV